MAEYAPITEALEWFVGEKKTLEFTIKDENDQAADITTWELEWVLRPAPASGTVLISKSSLEVSELLKSDPINGVCRVLINPDDTLAIPTGGSTYSHALKRSDGDNDQVLAFGEAVLQVAATR